jgi:putative flavoprotein involved in K+ transport
MADYVEAHAARFDLPVRTGVAVSRLVREGSRFVATADDRRYEAHNVVVATGGFQRPRVPSFADDLDSSILQLHSSHYRRPSQLRAGLVLVVGSANSGADIALELSQSHPTWLSGRHPGSEPVRPGTLWDRLVTPPFWFAASHLLTMRTPMGRKLRSTLLSHGHPLARGQTEGPGCRRCRAGAENNRSAEWHAGARGRPPRGRVERDLVHRVPARLGWIALPVLGEDGQRYTNVEL